jgi:hypothetical protein
MQLVNRKGGKKKKEKLLGAASRADAKSHRHRIESIYACWSAENAAKRLYFTPMQIGDA